MPGDEVQPRHLSDGIVNPETGPDASERPGRGSSGEGITEKVIETEMLRLLPQNAGTFHREGPLVSTMGALWGAIFELFLVSFGQRARLVLDDGRLGGSGIRLGTKRLYDKPDGVALNEPLLGHPFVSCSRSVSPPRETSPVGSVSPLRSS